MLIMIFKSDNMHHGRPATFRLAATQQEASEWWDVPPWIGGLPSKHFMPDTDTPSPKDFWVVRQEKTLPMAQVLQACTEELGAPTGYFVLCCMEASEMFGSLYDPQWGRHS